MTNSLAEEQTATLKIGAVARLTGVSVHTLRKWEDRYGAVEPRRSPGGGRIYTRTDLKRLALIKRMADAGMSLREVATLSLEELENAWEQIGATQPALAAGAAVPEKVRIAILGDVLPALLADRAGRVTHLEVTASADSETLLESALAAASVDVLVYECPSVQRETRERIKALFRKFPVRGIIVVYGFGARGHLTALRQANVAMMRAPVDIEELEHIAGGLLYGVSVGRLAHAPGEVALLEAEIPPRQLSNDMIARVAMSAPRVRCECPHHLADIVVSLGAFEDYSADCENRNAEDAELHHHLRLIAAKARALFEDAIVRVAEVEKISLED